ncbi:MAG: MFS transporter [Alphaproteobacteria bacterium]|nr:MFS transporter [Alphaproteobacteria bacterium]
MADAAAGAITAPRARERMDRGALSWALFEWARNPYVILCVIYVLAPYIATQVVGDPVRGQEAISGWHKVSGFVVALTAPFLGAAADRMGRRKPMLALVLAVMAPAIFLQWFAQPGDQGLPLWGVGALVIVTSIAFAYTEVLHNSMLTAAAKPRLLPHVSGLGLALGNAASVLLLVFVLLTMALPGQVDWSFVPSAPMFGLDAQAHEPSRIVAPLSAIWLVVFAIPLFLFTPDLSSTGVKFVDAAKEGLVGVVRTVRNLRNHRNVATFLVARMIYADGKTAILIFGGVYAAGVMHWTLVEMLAFGVILSVFAVFGGFAGGWLDDAIGPKNAVAAEIGVTLVCLLAMVSMSPDAMFFVIPVDPAAIVWNGPVFQTAPELAYIGASMVIAISITAAYASSRTLMARLSPKGMEGELFGLYALSGAATVWLGPMLVEYFTGAYDSQKAGFGSIAILLVVGFLLMLFVKPPPAPDEAG